MAFHAVCNTALSEWIILQSLKSESAPCLKLLSLKRKSWLYKTSLKRVVFKMNLKPFNVDVKMKH